MRVVFTWARYLLNRMFSLLANSHHAYILSERLIFIIVAWTFWIIWLYLINTCLAVRKFLPRWSVFDRIKWFVCFIPAWTRPIFWFILSFLTNSERSFILINKAFVCFVLPWSWVLIISTGLKNWYVNTFVYNSLWGSTASHWNRSIAIVITWSWRRWCFHELFLTNCKRSSILTKFRIWCILKHFNVTSHVLLW